MLDKLTRYGVLQSPQKLLLARKLVVDVLLNQLKLSFKNLLSRDKEKFLLAVGKLDALSPLKLMSSGYCVALDSQNMVIARIEQVRKDDELSVVVSDGAILCAVKNTVRR